MKNLLVLFFKSLVIGFSIAAPVGPIGMLCIRRTLSQGLQAGIFSGLGAAVADALYGLVAALGLASVSSFLLGYQNFLASFGGLFLLFLGAKTFCAQPAAANAATSAKPGLLSAFVTTFFLTITNPMTILSFVAIIASFGIPTTANSYLPALILVVGVFFGSVAWWLFLCSAAALARTKVDAARLQVINKISGIIIIGFGSYILLEALLKMLNQQT
ncbi:LysE family translocator [Candidatus Babeliales bacterium]|nr:LysE family translocator [Candidatus Babeliales bacterium]